MSDNILPYGENLKSLLVQQQLSESYVNSILKSKGVFIGNKSKAITVPILSSCLLTPSEYDEINEQRSERECSKKQRTEKLDGTINEDLENIIPEINIEDICQPEFGEYTISNTPSIRAVNNDPNHLIFEYTIKANNLLDSWTKRDQEFNGSVEFKKETSGNIAIVESYHTSKYTHDINKKYLSEVKRSLREQGKIGNKENKILFSSFDNKGRIEFLWNMTSKVNSSDIIFDRITDIDFKVDEYLQPPTSSEIGWMKDKIKRLHINGDTLQNIKILSDESLYPYLIIWKVEASFKFEILNSTGTFRASFHFSNYPKSNTAEFEIEILNLTFSKNSKATSKSKVRSEIYKKLGDIKLSCS